MRRHAARPRPLQAKAERGRTSGPAALPPGLRAGAEALSGFSLADVPVHYNSPAPARIGAEAFTAAGAIHVAPGQERHLPHETWHVVQQKQGRVRAAAKGKGAALNADPALEAEADHMGEAAARGVAAAPARLERKAAQGAVVQPKVKARDTWLSPRDFVSPTLLEFIMRDESYLLRDDFRYKLDEEPVHLMDMSKKYLLGEEHGQEATDKWYEQIGRWSGAGKLYEGGKELPRKDREKVGLTAQADRNDQALEDRNAYLMTAVITLHDHLNPLCAPWLAEHWQKSHSLELARGLVADVEQDMGEIDLSKREYAEFLAAYEKKKRGSRRLRKIAKFAVNFRDKYAPELDKLRPLVASAKAAVEQFDPADPAGAAALAAQFEDAVKQIEAMRFVLVPMAAELIVINVKSEAEEQALLAVLPPKLNSNAKEVLDAVDPARERGMADNIRQAEPPVLVKLGDKHVDDLAAMIGPSAVPIHWGESLEDETRQPKAP